MYCEYIVILYVSYIHCSTSIFVAFYISQFKVYNYYLALNAYADTFILMYQWNRV